MTAEKIKGPWRRVGHRQIMDAEGAVVCEVWSSVGIQEADANEDLISAAPDLLAALKRCSDQLSMLTQSALDCAAVNDARTAIAKATGAAA